MFKIYSIVLLVFFSCEIKQEENSISVQVENMQERTNFQDSLSIKKLMSLLMSEAIIEFGRPVSQERFILDDAQGEFRNGISDAFTPQERQRESIKIEELTWEKNEDSWITVWYQVESDKSVPKSALSWGKGVEF